MKEEKPKKWRKDDKPVGLTIDGKTYMDWKDYYIKLQTPDGDPPSYRKTAKTWKVSATTVKKYVHLDKLREQRAQFWRTVIAEKNAEDVHTTAETLKLMRKANLLVLGKSITRLQKAEITKTSDALAGVNQSTKNIMLLEGMSTENVDHRVREPIKIIFADEDESGE